MYSGHIFKWRDEMLIRVSVQVDGEWRDVVLGEAKIEEREEGEIEWIVEQESGSSDEFNRQFLIQTPDFLD